jgi:diguanylate cyclase (GGDEF)-like protein
LAELLVALKTASQLVCRLEALVEGWSQRLPAEQRQSFRNDFAELGEQHEAALALIERAWTRRERAYSFDETGLARRRPFYDHLVALLSVLDQSSVVSVLFVDVDGLKSINDRFGHLVGDQAVRVIGTLLRESLRVDRDRPDVLARTPEADDYSVSHYGGDEFVAALELKAPDDILGVVKRLRDRVNDPTAQRQRGFDAGIRLSASIGAVVTAPAEDAPHAGPALARTLVAIADEQMYAAKRDGRVHVAFAAWTCDRSLDRDRTRTVAV